MNASLREIITPGMAQRDVIRRTKYTALILGGLLSLVPGSLSVVNMIFRIVRLLDKFHNIFTRMGSAR